MLPDRADLQSTQGYVEQIKRISETLLHIGDHATLGKELLVTTALRAATLQRRNDEVAAFHLMYHDVSKRHSVGRSWAAATNVLSFLCCCLPGFQDVKAVQVQLYDLPLTLLHVPFMCTTFTCTDP